LGKFAVGEDKVFLTHVKAKIFGKTVFP